MSELLFYGGLIVVGFSVAGSIAAAAVLRIRHRRLLAKLDKEYGEHR